MEKKLTLAEMLALKNQPKAEVASTTPVNTTEEATSSILNTTVAVNKSEASFATVPANTKDPMQGVTKSSIVDLASASKTMREKDQEALLDELDASILQQATLTVDDVVPRIRQLDSLSDLDATNAMKQLKDALMANPTAVKLMYDEDVGTLVRTLRRITGQAIEEATTKTKSGKPKAVKEKPVDMSTLADDF